jgi:sugar-specific transcriptional regulator TrmB
MTTQALDANRLLAEIDISEQQERAYRLLLARGTLTVQDASEALQLADAESTQLLTSLEDKGLASRVPAAVLRFLPATPEVAIEALILKKQATLERTRSAIGQFKREVDQSSFESHRSPGGVIEVITERASILQAYEMLQCETRHELRCLIPAPFIATHSLGRERAPARTPAVRHLNVLDATAMTDPVAMDQVRARNVSPDEWRFGQSVPFRLLIADQRLALLPLDTHNPEGAALLVRPSSLLDGFNAMFDMIWNRAAPAELATQAIPGGGDSPGAFSAELEELIPLLAAGLNDKAIAHQLRISARTLMRRVVKLHTMLDARSRFQAGWSLALRLHGITLSDGTHAALSRFGNEPVAMHGQQHQGTVQDVVTFSDRPSVR